MHWGYQYNAYVLPSLIPLLFLVPLGIHCFRNRKVPGAAPFIVLIGLTILWILANSFGLSATEDPARPEMAGRPLIRRAFCGPKISPVCLGTCIFRGGEPERIVSVL